MKFLPPDRNIDLYEEGFEEDILNRAKVGKSLSAFLERIEDPLVVALDGRWGSGKTYFLKHWVGAHTIQNDGNATTIYFDAFANDYLDEPLIGLLGAVSDRTPKGNEAKISKAKEAAIKFSKPLARIALSAATYGATNALEGVGNAVADSVKEEATKGLDAFWANEEGRRRAVGEFRSAVEALTIEDSTGDKKYRHLIVVVDELDRCRPDYALEVLEIIKHFFDVPRVHFILGTNLEALENSVKARYGKEIDAEAYLRKFINVTFNLPARVGDAESAEAIVSYARDTGRRMDIPENIVEEIIKQIKASSKNIDVSIRDVGKILSSTTVLQSKFLEEKYRFGWFIVVITLVCSKVLSPRTHQKFLDASISKSDIMNYFGATKESMQMYIDGEPNMVYDHDSTIRAITWLYLANNGEMEDKEAKRAIGHQFDSFGSPMNIKNIPRRAHDSIIDIFNINQ